MEQSQPVRARYVVSIILFAAIIVGDLVLSRSLLKQGGAAFPPFFWAELGFLLLLVVGGILFCNPKGLNSNRRIIIALVYLAAWVALTAVFFPDFRSLYLSTLHTIYPSYGAAIACFKLVILLCGIVSLLPVAPAPSGREYARALHRVYQRQNVEQAKSNVTVARKDLDQTIKRLAKSLSPEEMAALMAELQKSETPPTEQQNDEVTQEAPKE